MNSITTARVLVYLKESNDVRDERNENLNLPSQEVIQRRILAGKLKNRNKLGNLKKVNESSTRLRYLRELAASSATMAQNPDKLKHNKNLYPETPSKTVIDMNRENNMKNPEDTFTNIEKQRLMYRQARQTNPTTA